jgi:hypothetical protein
MLGAQMQVGCKNLTCALIDHDRRQSHHSRVT